MTEAFPSNNNEGVILNDAAQASHTSSQLHLQHAHGQQMQLQQQHHSSSSMPGHSGRYNSNKTESTTTITTNIATTPASTASLHGDTKSEPHSDVDDDDDDDEEDEHGVESEPNCGGDVSGGESDHHRNYDTISLTPSGGSMHRRRHHGHGHGHSHNHGHGHSHYFHHHNNRHRRTPSTSSLASNTLRRGTHNNSSGGSGKNCCDYLKVTVSDHQSPKIYVEKCCAGGSGGNASGSSDHNLDDEVERYFYVHQGTNHSSSRKSSLAHGGGSSSQYGSHCSLNRSRCGSIRRRRSDHSITTTADVNVNSGGSRTTTPLIHRNSNERLRHLQGTRTMSPMMLEFHNSYQTNGAPGGSHRARASSSGSAGSGNVARDDGDSAGDFAEVRKAGVRIKCKHHSLEVSEDDIVLSLNEPGGGAESSCGAGAVGSVESGRGSSTSLKHLLERDESGEIVILTPSKITIENYPMLVRVPKTAPTTPEHHRRRREVIVSPLPDYATSPSPIHWHFPCSDSDGTGTSGGLGMSEDTTTSTSTDESHTVIQNFGKRDGGRGTKTVSIWRTSENSDEEASAMIFHHESGTVENYSGNSSRTLIRLEDPFPATEIGSKREVNGNGREKEKEKENGQVNLGPLLNNAIGRSRHTPEHALEMSHNNAFPTMSSVHDLSNEIRRFQKTSNFEPWTSNNLLSTIERNQSRRQREDRPDTISAIEMDAVPSTSARGAWNNGRHTTELPSYSPEDRFDLTSRLESFVRRFNKPSSIPLTTLNRLSPTATGHLNSSGTGGRIRNRFGGIERRRRRRKHQRSQLATIRRLLGGGGGSPVDDDHPHLLQTELDWINEDLMRTQAEHRQGRRHQHSEDSDGSDGGHGLMTNIQRRVKRTINLFKRS